VSSILDFVRGLSLRHKLLALVLGPLLLLTGTLIFLSAQWSTAYTYKQLFAKVTTDLNVTHDVFKRMQLDRQSALTSLANSAALLVRLEDNNFSAVQRLLLNQQHDVGFDFINLLNHDGSERLETSGWEDWSLKNSPLTDSVFKSAPLAPSPDTATGIEIYQPEAWQAEGKHLADKVIFELIDTPRAAPSSRTREERAMVIRVLQRVRDTQGTTLGVLEGGLLLNRNYAFVDEIRDLVYGPGSLAEGGRGTVTVFLDDVRITTNVPRSDDTRALGTRVSNEVQSSVLGQGTTWVNRAFVVNDWYISAYEPIIDVYGNRVGMLYAGYLEAPFRQDLFRGIALIAAVVLAGSLLAVVAAIMGAKSIFKPVESIARVVRATADGEHRRIGKLQANDEIGELATQFDSMLDTLEQHSAKIEANASELENKVQERTTELKMKNASLQESITMLHSAQQKLATAERLAAVGQLTAGVAHEINNPTAVILGNMDILIEEMGEHSADVQTEIDLIIEQVYRIRSITDRLLQYSRPSTTAPLKEHESATLGFPLSRDQNAELSPERDVEIDVNKLVESSLILVEHELVQKRIKLETRFNNVPTIRIDGQELQQVVINLVLNAAQATPENGLITITTKLVKNDSVFIEVEDNGIGIEAENIHRVFDPFFTHAKENGTGLGLSVSYGIVQRYGGNIDVASTVGEGSVFTVRLPVSSTGHRFVPQAADLASA